MNITFSITLLIDWSKFIGRYDEGWSEGKAGFCRGITLLVFREFGNIDNLIDWLMILCRAGASIE